MIRTSLLALLLLMSLEAQADIRDPFPKPDEFEADVNFWKRVYSEVDTDGGLLHDHRYLDVVYEVVRFPEGASRSERRRILTERREYHRDRLLDMAQNPDADTASARSLREKWGEEFGAADYRAAADRIRFQLGQSDRFRAGLERSGLWDAYIREVMREHGVPEGMVALPHVESSFTPYARSRVGASGMWQFTQGTGQRFMQVDHVVDERLDPWLSSVAAAQLLRHNYETTGSWPLALTAYNHGAAGVRRAVSVMGSDDIVTLNRQYEGRRFGFASRNFYPSFLAALDLHAEPHRYFNDLNIRSAEAPNSVKMEAYLPLSAVVEALDLAEETLRRLNPALRDPVWDGRKHIPRGYVLRLPQDHSGINGSELLAAVPEDQHFARQEPDRYHVLRRGETLSHVADRYGVGLSELVSANNLQNPHRVRVGQRLTLPGQAAAATARGAGARDGVHVLRRGESLSLVADRYDISLSELIAANDLANPHRVRQGQRLTLPGRGGGASLRQERVPADGQYRVRPGDNLSLIAQRFATSVSELNALNDFDNGDRIFPGQTIQVGQPRAEEVVETEEPEAPAEEDSQAETEVAAADPTVDDVPALEESPEAVIDEDAEPGVVATEMADAMLAETQPELAADPADYAVGSDGRVELQWGETLGHHADWLEIPTQRLRQLNELRFGQSVSAGDRLRLDFAQVSPSEYETRRHAFHQQIQAQFFQDHRIAGVEDYSVRSGDSLWVITRRFGNLPEWLLQQYNPDMDMARLRPGDTLSLPQVEDRQ